MRFLSTIVFALLLAGCGNDPCATAIVPPVGDGAARLVIDVIEQDGTTRIRRRSLECVDLLVLNPTNYADTLAAGQFRLDGNRVALRGLPTGTVDVILDSQGYFPAKFTDIRLFSGENVLSDKVLMFRTTLSAALPGHLGFTLRDGYQLAHVEAIYRSFEPRRVRAAPGSHYEVRLPFKGVRSTRNDVETLLGQLVRSRYVAGARPLVELSAVIRSG